MFQRPPIPSVHLSGVDAEPMAPPKSLAAPFIGTVTSVALMNIHESVREDAQADLARSSISSINMELERTGTATLLTLEFENSTSNLSAHLTS